MSEKIVLNTELNQTPMLTGQMIPLHEYLYENAHYSLILSDTEKMIAPLPDSRFIRPKYHWRLIYMEDTPLSIIGLVSVKKYSKYRMKN